MHTLHTVGGKFAAVSSVAGRDPADIRRLANVRGTITTGDGEGFVHGPPDQWVDQLASLALDHGVDTFILWPDGDPVEQTLRYAELIPTLRRLGRVGAAPVRDRVSTPSTTSRARKRRLTAALAAPGRRTAPSSSTGPSRESRCRTPRLRVRPGHGSWQHSHPACRWHGPYG